MIYHIICDNCGKILEIKAKSLKEAERKSISVKCCDK